jgi:lysine 2,3-aminomutase
VGPGKDTVLAPAAFEAALAYIAAHPEIGEVIFTGGDPFILSPRRVAEISSRLAAIPHIRILRWHTRVPVTDPDRITDEMVAVLQTAGATSWIAVHANHAREFGPEARRAIARLADAGIPLVSQSVLLKGVNDNEAALAALMRAFVQNRIKPYYLHHPDLAPGTSHFRPTIAAGLALMKALRRALSGLEMPAYMLDIPGGFGKIPLESDHLELSENGIRVRDVNGTWHAYEDYIAG